MPVILLSLQQSENVYLAEDGSWQGKYVPAFIRRYPFVLSQTDEQDKAFLCIDESDPGFNLNQEGSALTNEDGSATGMAAPVSTPMACFASSASFKRNTSAPN